MKFRACVIIPAFNCSMTIGAVVAGTKAHLPFVTVIDDGSTDETGNIALEAGAVVLRHPLNKGKGAALRTGFRNALQEGFRQAITLDGDSQHDPADIPRFLAAGTCFSDALILGARNMSHPNVPWTSRVGNRIANFFVNLSARQWLPDTQCGFRLYPLGPIDRLPLKGPGYEFESEVIVRAARIGMRFHTIPISIRYPGGQGRTTHFNLHRDTWRVFRCILRSFLWR